MKVNKIHVTIMAVVAVIMLSPCLVQAQDTSRNFVRTVTMLNAGGTDSLQAVQYYNAWDTRQSQPRINFPVPVIHQKLQQMNRGDGVFDSITNWLDDILYRQQTK